MVDSAGGAVESSRMDATVEIVGRDAEFQTIGRFLARAGDQLPAALVLEGEAGIGKTTLWRAAVERAEAGGQRVLSCALAQGESRLAFAGLADLAAEALGVSEALAEPQRAALEEALLLRTGAQALPDERAVAFGFLGLLRALTSETPVTLAIDDVQWLDPSSAAMLSFALRRLRGEPVLLLLARRLEKGGDPDPLLIERTSLPVEWVPVRPLTLGALHRLLRLRLGRSLTRPELRRVHDRSSGNPLHALELVRALDSSAPQARGSLTGLLSGRVAALPPQTRTMLLLAALAAEPDLSTLSLAGELDAREALQPALAAELVLLDREAVRFAHPLVAEAAIDARSEAVRSAHRALAAVAPTAEQRARHLGLAADRPDEAIALELHEAAASARRRGARAASAELYEEAGRLTPAGDVAARGRRLLEAGRACYEAGDPEHALLLLSALVEELPEGAERVEARWRLGTVLDETGHAEQAKLLWNEGLAATTDAGMTSELHRSLAYASIYTGSAAEAAEHADAAVAAAETSEDSRRIAYALGVAAFVAVVSGNASYERPLRRALSLEHELETVDEWSPSAVAAECRRLTGEVAESRHSYETVRRRAIEAGDATVEQWAAFGLAYAEMLSGSYARAAELADSVLDLSDQMHVMQIPARTLRAHVHAYVGDRRLARELVLENLAAARTAGEPMHEFSALNVLGFIEISEGDHAAAARTYELARGLAGSLGARSSTVLCALLFEVEAAGGAGLAEQSAEALDTFERLVPEQQPLWLRNLALRARAALLAVRNDLPGARDALEAAVAKSDPQVPFEAARTELAYGMVLRRMRQHTKGRAALTAAHATFESLGAHAWAARATDELARVPGRRTQDRGQLTEAERRIIEIVVAGRSNKEVAAALFLSVKTVEVTLTRVYRKLGVRSRTELAARLADAPRDG